MAGDTLFVFILIGVASLLFASGRVRLDMVAPGVLLMVVAAVLGSVTSSTAVVAILIPVTLTLSREARLPASRLLLPMSFAALISGMMTLIGTTPNLVVAAELADPVAAAEPVAAADPAAAAEPEPAEPVPVCAAASCGASTNAITIIKLRIGLLT